MDKDSKKLQKFLEALDEGTVSRDEFLEAFEIFMKVLKEIKSTLDEKVSGVNLEVSKNTREQTGKIRFLENTINNLLSTSDGKNSEKIKNLTRYIEDKIYDIKKSIPTVDFKPIEDKLYAELENLESKLPKTITSEYIRDSLEVLKGDERLDKSAINGLEEEIKELKKLIASNKGGGQVFHGIGGKGRIKSYDLSSQLNGVLKTFNLPAMWTVISVASTSSPAAFRPTIDYTFTPTSITFTSEINAATTLATGQTVILTYEEA